MIHFLKGKEGPGKALLLQAALLVGLSAGAALGYTPEHDDIILRDHTGTAINPKAATKNAYSSKGTCGYCHGNKEKYPSLHSYDEIEKHSYHAQLGANEIRGFNPWNPDDSADPFRTGAGPIGKNWVQSPGHVGSW